MSNLQKIFLSKGTTLSGAATKYNGASKQVPVNVFNSALDLNAVSLIRDIPANQTTVGLYKSNLDLNGKKPTTNYLDNPPERGIDPRLTDYVK